MNQNKIILDLCGGTGSWSKPYKDAGYDVRLITLPENDVRYYRPPEEVYGILAAPPCTQFSFARTNAKKERDLVEGMSTVEACLRVVWLMQYKIVSNYAKYTRLKFWALENPYFGLLKNFIGKPAFVFDPWEFGDGYQKRTAIWGSFKEPVKNPIPMTEEAKAKAKAKAKTNSYLHTMSHPSNRGKPITLWAERDRKKFDLLLNHEIHPEASGLDDRARRSITPKGFAKAFFEANQ